MQLFVAKTEEHPTKTQSTVDWLKRRDGEVVSDTEAMDSVLNIAGMKPKNLAEALAVQIVEPQISAKTSRIVEVFSHKRRFATVKSEIGFRIVRSNGY